MLHVSKKLSASVSVVKAEDGGSKVLPQQYIASQPRIPRLAM